MNNATAALVYARMLGGLLVIAACVWFGIPNA